MKNKQEPELWKFTDKHFRALSTIAYFMYPKEDYILRLKEIVYVLITKSNQR